jgi:hypothetical protein
MSIHRELGDANVREALRRAQAARLGGPSRRPRLSGLLLHVRSLSRRDEGRRPLEAVAPGRVPFWQSAPAVGKDELTVTAANLSVAARCLAGEAAACIAGQPSVARELDAD